MRRLDPDYVRAAWWAARSVRAARRQLRAGTLAALELPPAPPVDADAERGVNAVLNRTRSSCLVSAAVRQRWYAGHGSPRDLVIGVTAPSRGFEAHAWVEGDDPTTYEGFTELSRWPAR